MPEESIDFIDEFNNCYGPLRMQISELETNHTGQKVPKPQQFRLPTWYRQMWWPKTNAPREDVGPEKQSEKN